jgi:ABC-type sugar transport system ATPase subunit
VPLPAAEPGGAAPQLAVQGVTKTFGRTVAVDDLSFDLDEGAIVALLGENGAGKSTIIGVLAGLFGQDYDGELTLRGHQYRPLSVAHAERNGIVLIAQEINVVPDLTVAQSLFLNNEPTRWGLVDHLAMRRSAMTVLNDYGVDVDAATPIGALDLASQQLVMIARALHKEARILILDEPTAALTGDEADRLFDRLRAYRQRATTCVFVSHRLAEVFALADRILVLRDGALAGDHRTDETDRATIVAEMLGPTVAAASAVQAVVAPVRAPATGEQANRLRVSGLTVSTAGSGRRVVDDVTFHVHAHEIVGLFGLVGSGAGVVGPSVFGAWEGPVKAAIEVDGRPVSIRRPGDAIAAGIGLITQDRRDALVGMHSVAVNMAMASLGHFARGPFLDGAGVRTEARRRISQLSVRTPHELSAVATLSGGNQQKVQVARWLIADCPILILDDPTRGVDVGARAEIHAIMRRLAEAGRAQLLVSSDASELVAVCSRILVMRGGRIVQSVLAAETSEGALIELAAGHSNVASAVPS